jgi:hypothetical protein
MGLGQEHVPQTELARPRLQVLNDGRVCREALLCGLADLACVDGIGGNAFLLDELLNLQVLLVSILLNALLEI